MWLRASLRSGSGRGASRRSRVSGAFTGPTRLVWDHRAEWRSCYSAVWVGGTCVASSLESTGAMACGRLPGRVIL